MPAVPPDETRPVPEPVESNERAVIWVGIALWGVAFAIMLVKRDDLAESGRQWWLWTPVWGVLIGALIIRWLGRRGR